MATADVDLTNHLELDEGEGDHDSTLGYDNYTITTSLSPSVKEFRNENGRRYHSFEGDLYYLPNDTVEAARLDLQHYTWKITFDGGFGRVPITDKIRNVLDVGTGTGIWAIELADAHPEIQVIGTDLSPIQPDLVPPNCQFIVDNAELEWAFSRKFDYIHSRMLNMGMHDWPRFFRQAYDALTPGGWIETCEVQLPGRRLEGDAERPSAFIQWGKYVLEAAAKAGIDGAASEKFTEQLKAQGFVNVDRADVGWPMKAWAKGRKNKLIGRLTYENVQQAVPGVGMALLTRQLGWTKEQVDELSVLALRDIDETDSHYYCPMVFHKAQKPEAT